MPGLPKSQRLLTKRDFESTLNRTTDRTGNPDGSSLKIVCRDFVLVASQSDDRRPARLGLVVSGKVGNAVIRNRVKRGVREVFRTELSALPQLAGRNLVVIARPSLVGTDGKIKGSVQDSLRHCAARLIRSIGELSLNPLRSEPVR
jgi:ribonuclease P protein component